MCSTARVAVTSLAADLSFCSESQLCTAWLWLVACNTITQRIVSQTGIQWHSATEFSNYKKICNERHKKHTCPGNWMYKNCCGTTELSHKPVLAAAGMAGQKDRHTTCSVTWCKTYQHHTYAVHMEHHVITAELLHWLRKIKTHIQYGRLVNAQLTYHTQGSYLNAGTRC